jgi:aryl-alcohol dehydrogenase-like predicted oxidoreductase
MQNHYNLMYREEEREMIPQCIDQGVTAPIVGATKLAHIQDALAATRLSLSEEEISPSRSRTSGTACSATPSLTAAISVI